ncbi:MAG: hypothetical protein RNU03_13720 [Candidatus Sedimenticola sp. (ex Thyasira tokunagai)]
MSRHAINLYMWGYQQHYRIMLEFHVKEVFKRLGVDVAPKVLLVGALAPQKISPNPVCVEPEDNEWPLILFADLLDSIEATVKNHCMQNVFYGDGPSMRDKPGIIRKDSVATAVRESLSLFDADNGVRSFCSAAHLVDDYYVVPVIQIPESVFQQFPPLKETMNGDPRSFSGYRSFIHACMSILLSEAIDELHHSDPGRSGMKNMRKAGEIVRDAASHFMHTPGAAVMNQYIHTDLFERFNMISSLMYEGVEGKGQLLLANPDSNAIDFVLRFKEPVLFREPRWARKILQMAAKDIALIADSECIYGLGKLKTEYDSSLQNVFLIAFLDHYHWELRCEDKVLLVSHYGEPKLPQESITRDQFVVNYARVFPESSVGDQDHLWGLFNIAIRQNHGSMIIVAADAAMETQRLTQQGTVIEPILMTEELLSRVSDIDGTIILDPHGICHAVGVILDGAATTDCTPSRGSRFNSGLRYVNAGVAGRLAIVVSEDHTVDIIPMLLPQIKRDDIELNISALERATLDDYHKARNWLDGNRFYFNDEQCKRINSALDRIEALPKDMGEITIITRRFKPDPSMEDSYYLP